MNIKQFFEALKFGFYTEEYGWRTETRNIFGNLHSIEDIPALLCTNEAKEWYKNGEIHRDNDLPAVVTPNCQIWYQKDKKHREGDKPAAIYYDKKGYWYRKEWYKNGKKHREGNAAVVILGGKPEYWENGERIK